MEQHTYNQKYRNYIQPLNQNVFGVLDSRLQSIMPGWEKKNILDFGCNVGHLLGTSNGSIDPDRFYGVDIHKPSLYIARRKYPKAHWIHYNGYNATFNPDGAEDATFSLPVKPDVIIAYGVFTHCGYLELREKLELFKRMLAPGGIIAFSAWEARDFPGYLSFLKNSLRISVKPPADLQFERSMYMIDRWQFVVDQDELGVREADWVETFYQREFLLAGIPGLVWQPGAPTLHQVYTLSV